MGLWRAPIQASSTRPIGRSTIRGSKSSILSDSSALLMLQNTGEKSKINFYHKFYSITMFTKCVKYTEYGRVTSLCYRSSVFAALHHLVVVIPTPVHIVWPPAGPLTGSMAISVCRCRFAIAVPSPVSLTGHMGRHNADAIRLLWYTAQAVQSRIWSTKCRRQSS